jgi:hypothetical protein
MMKFITVYKVTRHCGGPEEGGWWYNWYEPIETVCIPRRWAKKPNQHWEQIMTLIGQMKRKYADEIWGNIYSVLGGQEINVLAEETYREYESKVAPHYE